jgi:hypothetical protein
MAPISLELVQPLSRRRRTPTQKPVRSLYLQRMVVDVKVFRWPDKGNHVIVISRGVITREGFGRIFHDIGQTTRSLSYCRVLIDLEDATYSLGSADLVALADEAERNLSRHGVKLALISGRNGARFNQILMLSTSLLERGFNVAAFQNMKDAAAWLNQVT